MGLFDKGDGRSAIYHYPSWRIVFLKSVEDGWILRARNIGDLGDTLSFEGLIFPFAQDVGPRLEFLGSPFANPGDALDLKFSAIDSQGKQVLEGGLLKLIVQVRRGPGHRDDNADYHRVSLPSRG